MYLCTETADQSRLLDDMLWTFASNSYIPHVRYEPDTILDSKKFSVAIGSTPPPDNFHDVLVSLRHEFQDFSTRFTRVMEPVGIDADDRDRAGKRFDEYVKTVGSDPTVHYI